MEVFYSSICRKESKLNLASKKWKNSKDFYWKVKYIHDYDDGIKLNVLRYSNQYEDSAYKESLHDVEDAWLTVEKKIVDNS